MKKFTLIFVSVFLIFTLCACGNITGGGNQNSGQTSIEGELSGNTSQGTDSSQGSVEPEQPLPEPQIGAVELLSYNGYFETAAVTFKNINNATGYNVYYKAVGADDSEYSIIDDELVRFYPDYVRADVIGLKAGGYSIKVVPVIGGQADQSSASVASVSVKAHERTGFAFWESSPNKTASGAYNEDGTLKTDAKVLYITKDNINTITCDVITNDKGKIETGTGIAAIMALRQKGKDLTPLCVRMIGTIKDSEVNGLNDSNYIQIKGCFNTTYEGVGDDATCYGWSFLVRDANNIEVRNFGFMRFKDDGISVDTDNFNIWIHNNDFFYGTPGSDDDQIKGDGSLDCKKSNYLTFSYNHFWDSGKASLCGMGEDAFFATYHHNWFDHSDSRHPRVRVATVHVYNNYFDSISKYGIGATTGSSIFAESNYFKSTKHPILSSRQGNDVASQNFSGEAGGIIKAYGNIFDQTAAPLDNTNTSGNSIDCYTVSNKADIVPAEIKTVVGGTIYNNFDTASNMYSYTADAASDVPTKVMTFAGRSGGGDLKWTFTAADTTSYSVNAALDSAITNYSTKLVSVGGNRKI